jgi:cytochrome c oxidase subunit 2
MVSNGSTRGLRLALLLVTAALVVGACGGDDDDSGSGDGGGNGGGSEAQSIEVTAANFAFDPTTIEVEPGQEITVTLVNDDDAEHSFTVEDLDVEVEAHGGESADVTFTAPDSGSVEFHCEYHPEQMRGEISIDGSAASSDSSGSGGRGAYDLDE